jgi:hypothetical protein
MPPDSVQPGGLEAGSISPLRDKFTALDGETRWP